MVNDQLSLGKYDQLKVLLHVKNNGDLIPPYDSDNSMCVRKSIWKAAIIVQSFLNFSFCEGGNWCIRYFWHWKACSGNLYWEYSM